MAEEGINAKIDRAINDKFEEMALSKKKKIEFKLPKGIKVQSKKKIKDNYVLYFYLRSNRQLEISMEKVENDMVYVKKTDHSYSASTDSIGYYSGLPFIIQPEWRVEPITPSEIEGTPEDTKSSLAQKIIINRIQEVDIKPRGGLGSGGKTILYIIGGSIAAYLLYSALTGQL